VQYEHVLAVNDATSPVPLTRRQLWNGLMRRVSDPVPFLAGLDHCELLAQDEHGLERELHFGNTRIRDRVCFESWGVTVCIRGEQGFTDDRMTMALEEPTPDALQRRFGYDVTMGEQIEAGSDEATLLCNAYRQADEHAVALIQRYALVGQLDGQ